jgi:hypothetical protein
MATLDGMQTSDGFPNSPGRRNRYRSGAAFSALHCFLRYNSKPEGGLVT